MLFARFDARRYIRAIEDYRLTMLTGVPTMYALILQEQELLRETDLTSVRACSMGSAPASDNLLDSLAGTFPNAALNLNYGITEGGPIMFSWKHPDGLEPAADDGGLSDRGGRASPRRRPGPGPGDAACPEPGGNGGATTTCRTTARARSRTAGSIRATC